MCWCYGGERQGFLVVLVCGGFYGGVDTGSFMLVLVVAGAGFCGGACGGFWWWLCFLWVFKYLDGVVCFKN